MNGGVSLSVESNNSSPSVGNKSSSVSLKENFSVSLVVVFNNPSSLDMMSDNILITDMSSSDVSVVVSESDNSSGVSSIEMSLNSSVVSSIVDSLMDSGSNANSHSVFVGIK